MGIDLFRKTFSSFKHKNFRLFFIGQFVSLIGTWMHQTALSWLVYEITGSKFMLGFIAAISCLPMVFLSIPAGVLADRYSKRKLLLITQITSMVLVAVLAIIISLNIYKIWHIVFISLLLGINFSIDTPTRQTFLVEITGKEDLMNGIALNSSLVNLARILGPAVAGVIMLKYGISWCFILNSLSFLAVIIALLYIKTIETPIKQRTESIIQYTIGGLKYVRQNKTIFDAMLIMTFMGVFAWSYALLFPAIAKDIFLKGEQGYAMLVSVNGAGAFLGALFVAYLGNSFNKRKIINYGIYFFSLMIFLLAISKIYWLSLIIISCAGMGLMIYFSACTTLIQYSVEDSVRGRVMGIWSLLFGGMMPLGNLFTGLFAQNFGISATLILSAAICAGLTFIISFISNNRQNFAVEKEETYSA